MSVEFKDGKLFISGYTTLTRGIAERNIEDVPKPVLYINQPIDLPEGNDWALEFNFRMGDNRVPDVIAVSPYVPEIHINILSDSLSPESEKALAAVDNITRYSVSRCCFEHVSRWKGLRELDVSGWSSFETDRDGMRYIGQMSNLENLKLYRVRHAEDDWMEPLASLSRLRSLSLGSTPLVTDAGIRYLGKLKNLEYLSLWDLPLMKWHAFSCAGYLPALTGLKITDSGIDDEGLRNVSRQRLLNYLALRRCPDITPRGLLEIQYLPNLETLELWNIRITAEVLEMLNRLRNLTGLWFKKCEGIDERVLSILDRHPNRAKLRIHAPIPEKELHLVSHFPMISLPKWDDDYCITNRFLKEIAKIPSITSLNLASSLVTDEGMTYLPQMPNLEDLDLQYTKITDRGLLEVCRIRSLKSLSLSNIEGLSNAALTHLRDLPKLEYVDIKDRLAGIPVFRRSKLITRPLTYASALYSYSPECLQGWSLFPELEHINIKRTKTKDEDLLPLVNLKKLRCLNLNFNHNITDKGLLILEKVRSLSELSLVYNKNITTAGMETLACYPKLKQLDLRATNINDSGLPALIPAPSLKSLNIRGCPALSEPARERFSTARPDVSVYWSEKLEMRDHFGLR